MRNRHPEYKLPLTCPQGPCGLEEILVHILDAGHGCHGNCKPGAKGDDKHGSPEQGGCHNHDNGNPGCGGNGSQKFDKGINPVPRLLRITTGNSRNQSQGNSDKISQKQQAQRVKRTFKQISPVLPCNVQYAVHTRNKGLGQDASFQSQIIIKGKQEKKSRKQRRSVAQVLRSPPVPLPVFNPGCKGIERVCSHKGCHCPHIGVRMAVWTSVWDLPVLDNSDETADNRKQHNNEVQDFLTACFFLLLQFL